MSDPVGSGPLPPHRSARPGRPAADPPPPPAAPRREWRRFAPLITVMVIVLIVAALVVGGDRVAVWAAERTAAGQLQSQLATPQRPAVDFAGFPFLNQVVRGRYDSVHVVADGAEVPVADHDPVAVAHADVTLNQVSTTNRFQTIRAGTAEGSFLLTYDTVSQLTGLDVEPAEGGAVRVRFTVPIGSFQVSGVATGRPVLDDDARRLTFEDVSVSLTSGGGEQSVADAVGRLVLGPVPLDALPYDLQLSGLEVRQDGVLVSGTGTDIPIRG